MNLKFHKESEQINQIFKVSWSDPDRSGFVLDIFRLLL